jgi:ubiquitin carboxyl-terminal hydrolase 34
MMEDVNCETCRAKVKINKRDCFHSLPNTMVFMLKRFETDLRTMTQTKLNSRFDFPHGNQTLNLKPYCAESIGNSTPFFFSFA